MRHKGFTLIELVIVMAIITILSSMFIMSAAESQRSADVTNIYNNLNNIKIAALAYYADNVGKNFDTNLTTKVKAYTHDWDSVRNANQYSVINDKTNKNWWAVYHVQEPAQFRTRLAARASSLGLKGTDNKDSPEAKPDTYKSSQTYALIKIRSGSK